MADIFISYSSEDRDRVISIVKVLEEQGWSTFWDWRSIPVGKTWRQFIEEGLIEASCVLVLWSKKSIVSEWVLEEADYGKSNGMLIPARMDDILPPFGFRQIQAANLINWTGDKINPEFNKLLVALEAIIGPSPKHVQEAERDRKEAGKKGFRKLARLGEKDVLEEVRKISLKELGLDVKTNKNKPVSVLVKQLTAKRTSTLAAIPKTYTNSIGMEFVLIPKGRFMMGSKLSAEEISKRYGGDADIFEYEHPQHEVTISKPFYLQSPQSPRGNGKKSRMITRPILKKVETTARLKRFPGRTHKISFISSTRWGLAIYTVCQPKLSGSTPVVQERPQNFHLEMIRVTLANMLGIEAMLKSEHIRLRKKPPIPGGCTTCTGM